MSLTTFPARHPTLGPWKSAKPCRITVHGAKPGEGPQTTVDGHSRRSETGSAFRTCWQRVTIRATLPAAFDTLSAQDYYMIQITRRVALGTAFRVLSGYKKT